MALAAGIITFFKISNVARAYWNGTSVKMADLTIS
jgi:hypothetical protein